MPPSHISPMEMNKPTIHAKETLDERQEVAPAEKMAVFSFAAWSIEDCLDEPKEVMINVRSRNKKSVEKSKTTVTKDSVGDDIDKEAEELDMLATTTEYWGAINPPPTIHLAMSEDAKQQWQKSYLEDPVFKSIAGKDKNKYNNLESGRRFFVDSDSMIFFSNEDYQPQLCVPAGQQNFILWEAHENPMESAHAGPECLWQSLSLRFYWKRMKLDIVRYCQTCNVCQKMKAPNFTKFGMLISNPIPS